ncbi:MAG: ABC transporter permease, partial [Bacilli bacterium]|nr:ABC transporter permease [Bacilli bacterium]
AEIVIKEGIVSVNSILDTLAKRAETMESIMVSNDITQDYIDYLEAMPKEYLEDISYGYGIDLSNNIYTSFKDRSNGNEKIASLSVIKTAYSTMLKQTEYGEMSSMIATLQQPFSQSLDNEEYILEQYDLKAGEVANDKDEIMIVINKKSQLSDLTLAQLGYYTQEEFMNMAFKSFDEEKYDEELAKTEFSYEELLGRKFYYYPHNTVFNKNVINIPAFGGQEASTITQFSYNPYADEFDEHGLELKVVGILQPKDQMNYGSLGSGYFYTPELTNYVREINKNSEIVEYIKNENGGNDIQSGSITNGSSVTEFGIKYTYEYIKDVDTYEIATATGFVGSSSMMSLMGNLMSGMAGGAGGSNSTGGSASAPQTSSNIFALSLRQLGGAEMPSTISIYPVNFELKEFVLDYLNAWNDEDKDITLNGVVLEKGTRSEITYTDTLSIVISMINTMIDVVTTALVIFTAISLVVSTVMIGIITYVSVVERTKEIGVIRSLGGSKKDVGHLFNAETFIIGLVAGLLGIGITYLLSALANVIIGNITGIYTLAALRPIQAIVMIIISVLLTSISGLTPAKAAARMDPVNALRSE